MTTKLLTLGNTKTAKGEKLGYLTGIMHLAPSDISGHNVCPMAKPLVQANNNVKLSECSTYCLNLSGRSRMGKGGLITLNDLLIGDYTSVILNARKRKTELFFSNRELFLNMLHRDIVTLVAKAERESMVPAVRLNGTSDLDFTAYKVDGLTLFEWFPTVQFYDYTKVVNRFKNRPDNYHLTYSMHDGKGSEKVAIDLLNHGHNVAMVFPVKRGKALQASWRDYRVIDGDVSDLRFTDPLGVIVGLRAKGYAVGADSKFIQA